MGMHDLHTVDKSQNRNNSSPPAVDNLVDGVDRYASIHPFEGGMNIQYADRAAEIRFGRPIQASYADPEKTQASMGISALPPQTVTRPCIRRLVCRFSRSAFLSTPLP